MFNANVMREFLLKKLILRTANEASSGEDPVYVRVDFGLQRCVLPP